MASSHPPRLVLAPLFKLEMIELNLRGGNRQEVLAEMVAKIPPLASEPGAQRILLRALEEREQLCSTGIGDGVAMPHCRNALVGLVEHPVIVFGRHSPGISYGSVDNNPARLLFLLLAPTVSQHLQILARLSRLLRDPKLRKALLTADRPEKICSLIRDAEAGM